MKAEKKIEIPRVTLDAVKERLDRGFPTVFIDAQDDVGWNSSDQKIPGALRIDLKELDKQLDLIPLNQSIIVYGNSEQQAYSEKVAQILIDRGFKDIFLLDGGFYSWLRAGYPLESKVRKETDQGDSWTGLVSGEKV
jgi:rhodanese-related sulfurtransferase